MGKSKPRRRLPRSRRRLLSWLIILFELGSLLLLAVASWTGLPTSGAEIWARLHSAWLLIRASL